VQENKDGDAPTTQPRRQPARRERVAVTPPSAGGTAEKPRARRAKVANSPVMGLVENAGTICLNASKPESYTPPPGLMTVTHLPPSSVSTLGLNQTKIVGITTTKALKVLQTQLDEVDPEYRHMLW